MSAWLTVEEFGAAMKLPRSTVTRLCRDGALKAKKVGRAWRVHRSEAEWEQEKGRAPKARP